MPAKQTRGAGAKKPDHTTETGRAAAPTLTENDGQPSLYVQIADRAYYIWIEKGKPEDRAMDFWFQAEAQVLSEHQDRLARREA